jgi:hypothetical protein
MQHQAHAGSASVVQLQIWIVHSDRSSTSGVRSSGPPRSTRSSSDMALHSPRGRLNGLPLPELEGGGRLACATDRS